MSQPEYEIEDILRRIEARLMELGISESEAGLKVGNKDIITGVRRGLRHRNQQSITTQKLHKIAKALGTSADWLLTGGGPAGTATPTPLDTATPPAPPASDRLPGTGMPLDSFQKDLPVLGTAAGSIISGVTGLYVTRRPLNYIQRPPRLAGIPNAYAVRVVGKSMEPMLRSGDLCIINPNETAAPGDTVIVQTQHYDSDPGQAYVKILLSKTASTVSLLQTNPQATLKIPREYVSSIHRVLTVSDLFSD